MSETTFYLIGIAVLCALIFFSAAKTLGEFAFLLSLVLIGGGYAAVLAQAFFGISAVWAAVVLTALGMIVGRLSAQRDIPTVEWRAAGLHATLMAAMFTALAGVTIVTMPLTPGNAYKAAGGVYALLALWHWTIALRMAWWVMSNYDGKSK
jgi:hypothetical protein